MSGPLRPPPKPLTPHEARREELNEWIAWLEEWTNNPPGYKAEGPLETTRGIRRLNNFLRGLAYDWPLRKE